MSRSFEDQLLDLAVRSNDGMLCGPAMQAAERLKTNADRIAALEAQLAEADARAIRLAEMVKEEAVKIARGWTPKRPSQARVTGVAINISISKIDPRALMERMK